RPYSFRINRCYYFGSWFNHSTVWFVSVTRGQNWEYVGGTFICCRHSIYCDCPSSIILYRFLPRYSILYSETNYSGIVLTEGGTHEWLTMINKLQHRKLQAE